MSCVEKRPIQKPIHVEKFQISMPLEYDHFLRAVLGQNDLLGNLKKTTVKRAHKLRNE